MDSKASLLKNLKKIWGNNPRISQYKAAKMIGISQSAVNHYLTGRAPLNTDMIINFAKVLNVYPYEIDPRLNWDGFVDENRKRIDEYKEMKYEDL